MNAEKDSMYFSGKEEPNARFSEKAEVFFLYAAVFLSPLLLLRPGNVLFTASDACFFLCFLLQIFNNTMPRLPLGPISWLWTLGVTLLIGGLLTSSIIVGDPTRGLIVSAQYLVAYQMLAYVIFGRTERQLYICSMLLITSMVLIDIHGILTVLIVGYQPDSIVAGASKRLSTLIGGTPNLAAALNAITIPMIICWLLSGRMKWFVAVFSICVIFYAIILTSSNSGLATAFFAILVLLVCTRNVRLLCWGAVAVIGLMAFGAMGGTELLPDRFQRRVLSGVESGNIDEAGTFSDRWALMVEAARLIEERQLFVYGLGVDQFKVVNTAEDVAVHNLYLLVWSEGGLFAILGLMIILTSMIAVYILAHWKGIDKNRSAAMLAVVIAFAAFANANPHMYGRHWTTPILIAVGIVAASLRAKSREIQMRHAP